MNRTRTATPLVSRRTFLAGSLAAAAMAVLPAAPALAAPVYRRTALLMGTFVEIGVSGAPEAKAEDACRAAFAKASALEGTLTRFDASSALGVLNAQGTLSDVPPELALVLARSAEIHGATAGSFDPSVLPVLALLQAGAASGSRPSSAELRDALSLVDFSRVRRAGTLRLPAGMSLTLDGVAKGHIAQEMSRELARMGCPDHIVNAGGDVVAAGAPAGRPSWNVGIRSPFGGSELMGAVPLTDAALATSGVYEQSIPFASGSHLVIPRTLEVPEAVSASVLAPDGLTADALATAFSTMPPAMVRDFCARTKGVEAMLVLRSGATVASAGWPA